MNLYDWIINMLSHKTKRYDGIPPIIQYHDHYGDSSIKLQGKKKKIPLIQTLQEKQ